VRAEGDVRLVKMLPSQPADVFAGRDLVVLARYTGHGSARIVVEGSQRGAPVQWTSRVDFPERDRGNAFVARLWATQRVGLLSADKRRNGGSTELDEEIRTLGERFGIPTEFTSYLVQEPGMGMGNLNARQNGANAMRLQDASTVGGVGGARPPAASPARDGQFQKGQVQSAQQVREQRFEQAKAASAQQATISVAQLDSSVPVSTTMKRVDARTFTLSNGVWTDVRYKSGAKTVSVKAYSKAYFDLIEQLPELRAVFALGDRVIVVGRDAAITVSDSGAGELSAAELARIVRGW
jgi:Ca-activated chloride channel family protein